MPGQPGTAELNDKMIKPLGREKRRLDKAKADMPQVQPECYGGECATLSASTISFPEETPGRAEKRGDVHGGAAEQQWQHSPTQTWTALWSSLL